jgi:hypothetical protein
MLPFLGEVFPADSISLVVFPAHADRNMLAKRMGRAVPAWTGVPQVMRSPHGTINGVGRHNEGAGRINFRLVIKPDEDYEVRPRLALE